jgi:alginate O-acetyltransferase complex protein AlgI
MLFPTTHFLLFFLVVAAVVAALEHRFTAKKAVLVVASYYFYAQWDWRFCFLLGFSTTLSYVAGLLIGGSDGRTRRRILLGVAVGLHLALLGVFKYLDFFVLSANELARLCRSGSRSSPSTASPT